MDSKKEIFLVVNPISGGSDKKQLISDIKHKLSERGHLLTVHETTGQSDQEKIQQKLREKEFELLLIAGGDGTVQMVARAVKDIAIDIALIPAGSANGLASNLKIPASLDDQLNIALGSNSISMDMLSINDHYCLHIADMGINASLIENYENSSIRGKLGYALQTIPTLVQAELPYNFTIVCNGKSIQAEGVMVAIANAKQFGTGAIINPEGKMDDGLFEILVFKNLNVIEILKTLNENWESSSDFVETFQTDHAQIYCTKRTAFQVDGEFIGHEQKLDIKMVPYKLKMKLPNDINL